MTALQFEMKDDGDPAELVTKALADLTKTVDDRLKVVETKSADAIKLGDRLDKIEAKLNRPGGNETKTADNDNVSLERKAFTTFVRSGREALAAEEVKSLIVGDDPRGGYLAPPEFNTEMIRNLIQFSPVRAAARVGQTGQPSVVLAKRTGITAAQWEGETEDSTESEPAFGQIEIPVFGMKTGFDPDNPAPASDGERITFADYHAKLYRIATGWLGWSPQHAWDATPNEILEAYQGHLEMLRAVHGGGEPDTEPSRGPDNSEFDREGFQALKSMGRAF